MDKHDLQIGYFTVFVRANLAFSLPWNFIQCLDEGKYFSFGTRLA